MQSAIYVLIQLFLASKLCIHKEKSMSTKNNKKTSRIGLNSCHILRKHISKISIEICEKILSKSFHFHTLKT